MNKAFDRTISIVFLAVGTAFAYGSLSISSSAYGSHVGPNIFPLGLGILLMLISLRLFYETLKYPAASKGEDRGAKLDYKRFLVILASTIGYIMLLEEIGYVISTFIFLLIGFQTMERGKWLYSAIISAGFSIGVYYVYVELLKGTLPGLPSWLGL